VRPDATGQPHSGHTARVASKVVVSLRPLYMEAIPRARGFIGRPVTFDNVQGSHPTREALSASGDFTVTFGALIPRARGIIETLTAQFAQSDSNPHAREARHFRRPEEQCISKRIASAEFCGSYLPAACVTFCGAEPSVSATISRALPFVSLGADIGTMLTRRSVRAPCRRFARSPSTSSITDASRPKVGRLCQHRRYDLFRACAASTRPATEGVTRCVTTPVKGCSHE